jgi:hypothetical protein
VAKKKQKWQQHFEFPEEKAQQLPGRQYGNDIRKRQAAVVVYWQMIARPYDLPAGRAEIFSALHKK